MNQGSFSTARRQAGSLATLFFVPVASRFRLFLFGRRLPIKTAVECFIACEKLAAVLKVCNDGG
jgi:hypothetical protein